MNRNVVMTLGLGVSCGVIAMTALTGCGFGNDPSDTSMDAGSNGATLSDRLSGSAGAGLSQEVNESDAGSADMQSDASGLPTPVPIGLDDLIVGGISLNITRAEFLAMMTEDPVDTVVVEDEVLGFVETTLRYEGLDVVFLDDVCFSIRVTDERYSTARGLRIGDSADTVISLYGEPQNRYEDHWGYEFGGTEDYEVFSLTVQDGIVVEIVLRVMM